MSAAVDSLLARLTDVERRLAEHAAEPLPPGQTDPDPGGDERWEAGQVWAHLAEFPSYWLRQAHRVASRPTNEPIPFGRVRTDPARTAAIERDRHVDPHELLERVRGSLAEVSDALRGFSADDWKVRGVHPTRGEMSVRRLVEYFILEHLEEHAAQLDALRGAGQR